jgi:hypothetical protein
MNKDDLIDRINAALGPRKVSCMGIGMAGAKHATNRSDVNEDRKSKGEKDLYGVIWVSEEEFALSKQHDFVWFVDIAPEHVGKLEERPPEIQKLPAHISVYAYDPASLFEKVMGTLFTQWSKEKRFKTEQKWFHPGVWDPKLKRGVPPK